MAPETPTRPEVWGGVECTVNRVGERYFNQLTRSGHDVRASDLEAFAALGLKAMRYPVLWELVAPNGLRHADWSWTDERLNALRSLGMRPIAGLLHHGSGPRTTNLLDPELAPRLAAFGRAVAERYPWIDDYTPVNEPLTTARFAGLYGHWYPHARDDASFVRALIHQCLATALTMRAIREVNPRARLVQTEDLGTVFSTPRLAYQAAFENQRRWLSFDLLFGRVDREHPLWSYLLRAGASVADLELLQDDPCPPDIVGLNHYVTSDRFLDEGKDLYPPWSHGGNGHDSYADVHAALAPNDERTGHDGVLTLAWERYRQPVALTEVHIDSTRESQLRWLAQAWRGALAAHAAGAEVRAVTAWALLGAHDWNTLITCDHGYYESGAFDVRAPAPRPTAVAHMLRGLAQQGCYEHPVLETPGWWAGELRRLSPEARLDAEPLGYGRHEGVSPLLITGATGTLGRAFARACEARALPYRLVTRAELDIADASSVADALDALRPWAVINTAGFVRVDDAEREEASCRRENTLGAATLARACAGRHTRLLTFSSDLVFDGEKGEPYLEQDPVAPLSAYGRSKAAAERLALEHWPEALVVRTSTFFGPWDEHNLLTRAMRAFMRGESVAVPSDLCVSPTYVPDLVRVCLDLLIDGTQGLWHVTNQGALRMSDLVGHVAERLGKIHLVRPRPALELGLIAPRPRYSALVSGSGHLLPPLEDALERFLFHRRSAQPSQAMAG